MVSKTPKLNTLTKASIHKWYLEILGRINLSTVFVTHDIDEAILLSDKIVMMTAHPGQVYKEIDVPFARPRNRAQLVQTKEYNKFRNRLLAMFYSDIVNKIGGEEVVL